MTIILTTIALNPKPYVPFSWFEARFGPTSAAQAVGHLFQDAWRVEEVGAPAG